MSKRKKNKKYDITAKTTALTNRSDFKRPDSSYRVTYSAPDRFAALRKAEKYFGLDEGQRTVIRKRVPWTLGEGGFSIFKPKHVKTRFRFKVHQRKK